MTKDSIRDKAKFGTTKGRIKAEKIGQLTYYSPQIQVSFFGIKYWQTIYSVIYGGSILYCENRCQTEEEAEQHFLKYTKLTNKQIIK